MFVNSNAGINKLGLMSTAFPEVCVDSWGAGMEVAQGHSPALLPQPARKIKISAWPAAFRGALAPAQSRLSSQAGWRREDRLPKPHLLLRDMSRGYLAWARLGAQQWGPWPQSQGGYPAQGWSVLLPPKSLMLLRVLRCEARCGISHFQAFH